MFMSREEKRLLEAIRTQVNGITETLICQSCGVKLKTMIFSDGNSCSEFTSKPIERPSYTDIDAHERINALCEALGYTVESEPERYVVRKKKKKQPNE